MKFTVAHIEDTYTEGDQRYASKPGWLSLVWETYQAALDAAVYIDREVLRFQHRDLVPVPVKRPSFNQTALERKRK